MNLKLVIFVSKGDQAETLIKTIESDFRPHIGDIIDDPGFDPGFHNGYEVVKVTINYDKNECLVSLAPLVVDLMEISFETYIDKLISHGWEKLDSKISIELHNI